MAEQQEHQEKTEEEEKFNKEGNKFKIGNFGMMLIVIAVILLLVVLFNTYRISKLTGNVISNNIEPVSASEYIPAGVPKIYGNELKVSYGDVSTLNQEKADSTISILGNLDNSITLTSSEKERYIKIASQISCEYCCGAQSIINSKGEPACGCAHSYAMRGLAKYLIKNHGTEFSDDEILEELGKWKVLFFPEIHGQKATALKNKGIELNYINLASNKYRGIEKGATGSMVGGC